MAAQDQDFNSDDIDFGQAPPKNGYNPRLGLASIESMITHAADDRRDSKRQLKQLQFGHGSPGFQLSQALWVRRFEHYRENTLGQDLNKPFTGDDLFRFFVKIIDHIRPNGRDKPAPNQTTIVHALRLLIVYGHFKWSEKQGYKIDKHDALQLTTWMDDAVKSGRLIRGTWKERTWIGFTTLCRIVRVYLQHMIRSGSRSWDIDIARCLSVVLCSSLGARAGDVARSNLYTGEQYMQYRHIELFLDGDGKPVFANLAMRVTIEFAKGLKDVRNNESVHYFKPLNAAHNSHICPIALLLVHALRHGLVAGTTLQDVLNRAAQQPDRMVQWLFPKRPVLAAFSRADASSDVVLDKPANARQVLDSIKKMGLIAGCLGRMYSHALRNGAFRDVAHLPASVFDGAGVATEPVRQSLGHMSHTMAKGITERYIGGISANTYNDRAENSAAGKVHQREPKFASLTAPETPHAIVTRSVSEEEIQAHVDDSGKPVHRVTLQRRVRQARLESLAAVIPREHRIAEKTLFEESPLPPTTLRAPGFQSVDSESSTSSNFAGQLSTLQADPDQEGEFGQNVDPASLNEDDLADVEVPVEELQHLRATLMCDQPASNLETPSPVVALDELSQADLASAVSAAEDEQETEAARIILEPVIPAETSDDQSPTEPEEWIATYAKYNLVASTTFSQLWTQHAKELDALDGDAFNAIFGSCSNSGNSRDPPQPFEYSCRQIEGCPYKSISKANFRSHQMHCTPDQTARHLAKADYLANGGVAWACPYEACSFVSLAENPRNGLTTHIQSVHNWQPKPCEHNCDPNKLYYTYNSHYNHIQTQHSARWPARCGYPGCSHPTEYKSTGGLQKHLREKHKLALEDMDSYLPPPEIKHRRVYVEWQPCLFQDCEATPITQAAMIAHLQDPEQHGIEYKAAVAMVDEQARFGSVKREPPKKHARVATAEQAFQAPGEGKRVKSQ